MSIALMTEAFKTDLPLTRKMVLLALCDNANDQGECYPSVSMLVGKCSMSERAIQTAIVELEKDGFLKRDFRKGRSTLYVITNSTYWPKSTPAPRAPHPRTTCTPASDALPQEVHPTPARGAPPPPQEVHPTPAPRAPITIIEPSIEPSGNRHIPESPKKSRAPVKTPLPENFCISERVRKWADEKGHRNLERHFENFVGACRARGYAYADWDEAFMNAIRNDWAKLNALQARNSPAYQSREEQQRQANEEARRLLFGNGNDKEVIDV